MGVILSSTASVSTMAEAADSMANPASQEENGMIIYAAVANWRHKTILVDFTSKWDHNESCEGIVQDSILPALDAPSGAPANASQYQDSRIYYTSFDDDTSVIHVCTKNYKVQHSLVFQQQVHDLWEKGKFAPDSPADRFKDQLQKQVETFTLDPPKTKFDQVQDKQNEIKEVLINNIESVVKRHGQIEITLDGTETLKETSRQFSQSSRKVKQTAQCQLYKSYAIFALIALVLIGVVVIVICVAAKC